MAHAREEVEAAFEEYKRLGAFGLEWEAWADLFTDDAEYIEHNLGVFQGRDSIKNWIVGTMSEFQSMTFAIDWAIIDGDRVAFYIWNLLPDPKGGTERYGFPNATVIEYAGGGKWCFEEDYYNPANADAEIRRWIEAGGRRNTPADRSITTGIPGFCPEPVTPAASRDEVEAEFWKYVQRGVDAVATNDWSPWADQFTDGANYYEHHFGKMQGRENIRTWIMSVMQPFPGMEFPVDWHMIDGNRVVMRCPNVFPDPKTGERLSFPVFCVLHYAGNGQWSYEEDIYHPGEAEAIVNQLMAG